MTTVRYRWKNLEDSTSRWKIARLIYYEPWDWVIGVSVYEDEFQVYQQVLSKGRTQLIRIMGVAGIVIAVLTGILGLFITWLIMRPIRQMTEVAEKIISGDLNHLVKVISHDEIGVLAGTFNIMTSKLNQSIASLRESEEKYRGIFNYALEGIFQSTVSGRVLNVNPALAQTLGYNSPEELIVDVNDLKQQIYVNPDDRDRLITSISQQGKVVGFEVQNYRKDRTKIWVSLSARLTFDETGKPAIIEGFLSDITAQKNAETEKRSLEAQLNQSQKLEAIGTMAGGIAHDFNNILGGIMGYSELLRVHLADNCTPNCSRYLENILFAVGRARDLIRQILIFSRRAEIEVRPVPLRQEIEETVNLIRASLPTTITIEQHLGSEAFVMTDRVQLHQIILNLCSNASYAMKNGKGVLTIQLNNVSLQSDFANKYEQLEPGNFAHIQISDNGRGIPEHLVDRIFDPFFTTKKQGEGTGLGLAMVHGIVNSMKGLITVKSKEGHGTQFDIYLPTIAKVEEEPEIELQNLLIGHEHIVYVDDDPLLIGIGKEISEELGYKVTTFCHSNEALDFLCNHHIEVDLIITDLTMPDLTGLDLARSLHAKQINVPIILCTGNDEQIDANELEKIGIKAIMLKPVSLKKFADKVRYVIDSSK